MFLSVTLVCKQSCRANDGSIGMRKLIVFQACFVRGISRFKRVFGVNCTQLAHQKIEMAAWICAKLW